jgi:hypothetical protein
MPEQREELLVRIRVTQRVLGLIGRHIEGDVRAVLRMKVVPERGEDETVHATDILTASRRRR